MTLAVVLLAMLAGGIFWYWQALPKKSPVKKNRPTPDSSSALRKSPAKKSMPASKPAEEINKYRAVSIQCKENSCSAAKTLVGTRFLTNVAPQIPLPECDHSPCQCSYARHDDQRTDNDDRRSVHSLQTELYTRTAEEDRRAKRGRRKGDGH